MFIAITLRVTEQTEDGRHVRLEAEESVAFSTTAFGTPALEADGSIRIVLPTGVRLAEGDVVTGYVRTRKKDHADD